MNIAVASGKGGTGKTTFATNLAWVLSRDRSDVRLLDCDVEEPNSSLFIKGNLECAEDVNVLKPVWYPDRCRACGECVAACRYNALALVKEKVLVFNELCHGCGACSYVCPTGALREEPVAIGTVAYTSENNNPFFAEGRQNVGETLAPAVVRGVQSKAVKDAVNICDSAPGTACPVVEAMEGCDVVVLVTEPTPFGLHDLRLALDLALSLKKPVGIVVNRSEGEDRIIADFADEVGVPVLGRIPFKREYAETYSRGELLAERQPDLKTIFMNIFERIQYLSQRPPLAKRLDSEILPQDTELQPFSRGERSNPKEIVVLSGKGGTGKTTVLGSFAKLAGNAVLADGDVDASDLHLLLPPRVREQGEFEGNRKAVIDLDACIGCGACADICHFDAIDEFQPEAGSRGLKFVVDQAGCEGCELCPRVCPVDAISLRKSVNGKWFLSRTDWGPIVHASLGAGEENSGQLVTLVRQKAVELARELGSEYVLIDGPPGTSCPAIAAVTDADLAVIVTEPTVSGVHDLERVLELCRHFAVPTKIVINKTDLNPGQVARIKELAAGQDIPVIAEIPFDRNIHEALLDGNTPVDDEQCPSGDIIRDIWEQIFLSLFTLQPPKGGTTNAARHNQ